MSCSPLCENIADCYPEKIFARSSRTISSIIALSVPNFPCATSIPFFFWLISRTAWKSRLKVKVSFVQPATLQPWTYFEVCALTYAPSQRSYSVVFGCMQFLLLQENFCCFLEKLTLFSSIHGIPICQYHQSFKGFSICLLCDLSWSDNWFFLLLSISGCTSFDF